MKALVRISAGLMLAGATVSAAQAQTACESLSGFVESVSLVRQIQTNPGAANEAARFDRLADVADTLSLPALLPADPSATRVNERAALIGYVSGLREAVTAQRSGHALYAEQALGTLVSPDLFAGMASLDSLWECRDSERQGMGNPESETASNSDPAFRGEGGGDDATQSASMSNPATAPAASRNRATASGDSEGKGAYFARGAIVTANTAFLLSILIGLLVIGILFWLQKRIRRQTVREARRTLDRPVLVAIGGEARKMHIVDISMQGFKLRHNGHISGEDELSVQLDGQHHRGQIRWSNANFAGVKFRRALLPERLAAILEADAAPLPA